MDRNIIVILQEWLPEMLDLEEFQISSMMTRAKDLFQTVKSLIPKLRKLSIPKQYIEEAKDFFGNTVEIYEASNFPQK